MVVLGDNYYNGGNAVINYEYRLDNGSYTSIGLNTSYTITSLVNGRYYVLYVRARNNAGPSLDISALIYSRTTPTAPVITNVTPNDGYGVVSFNPPDSSGGAIITNYEYTLDLINYTSIGADGLANQYFTINGLTNGTSYSVILIAQNEAGYSPLSNSYVFVPRTVPNPPTIDTITLKDRSVDISLGLPSYDGGNTITGYEYVLNGGSNYVDVGNTLFFTISALVNGQYYIVRVRSRNAAGPSADVSSSFIPRTVPSAPTISSYTLNDRSVYFVFIAPDSSGGNAIVNYEYSINNWTNTTIVSADDT
jgi:titin